MQISQFHLRTNKRLSVNNEGRILIRFLQLYAVFYWGRILSEFAISSRGYKSTISYFVSLSLEKELLKSYCGLLIIFSYFLFAPIVRDKSVERERNVEIEKRDRRGTWV